MSLKKRVRLQHPVKLTNKPTNCKVVATQDTMGTWMDFYYKRTHAGTRTHTHTHAGACMHAHAGVHTRTHTCRRTRIRVHTHTYIGTHTHAGAHAHIVMLFFSPFVFVPHLLMYEKATHLSLYLQVHWHSLNTVLRDSDLPALCTHKHFVCVCTRALMQEIPSV